jgi:hypothetical protein
LHSARYNQPSEQRVWIIESPEFEKRQNKQVQQEEKNKEVQEETKPSIKDNIKKPSKRNKKK